MCSLYNPTNDNEKWLRNEIKQGRKNFFGQIKTHEVPINEHIDDTTRKISITESGNSNYWKIVSNVYGNMVADRIRFPDEIRGSSLRFMMSIKKILENIVKSLGINSKASCTHYIEINIVQVTKTQSNEYHHKIYNDDNILDTELLQEALDEKNYL